MGSQTTDSVLNDSFFDIVPSASGGSAIVREENGEKYIELTRGSNSGGATLSVKPTAIAFNSYNSVSNGTAAQHNIRRVE